MFVSILFYFILFYYFVILSHSKQETRIVPMKWQTVIGLSLLQAGYSFGGCPDLTDLRTDYVVTDYDASMLDGFWYEVAYQDIAQVGETCQCYNKTYSPEGGGISEKFGFTYKSARAMMLQYTPTDTKAVYTKTTSMGVSTASAIPTVVMDIGLNSDGSYATITEYSCFVAGPVTYQEIRVGSRTPVISEEAMAAIETTLTEAGLDYRLKYVTQSADCEYNVG
jgi:hypothetical protein